MARSRSSAAFIPSREAEFEEIKRWYRDQVANTAPPSDLTWEPVKIGPTWQWDNGWALPEATLGWDSLAWAGYWLRDKHGQPWQMTPEQTRFHLWYHAVDPDTGDPLFHSAVLQRLKGWGKDPFAAVESCVACFAPVRFDRWDGDRPVGVEAHDAWVQIIAVSLDQTKNTMKLFPSLISAEARQHYGIQVGKRNVYGLGDTRQIEAVTASPLAVEGGRPTQVIRGETQNWNASNSGHDMAGALEGNAAKSEGGAARMLDICNAYRPGEDSVGERRREAWEATQGEDAKAVDFGLLYDSLEAPPDAPLTQEAAPEVLRAIRGDSVWLDVRPNGRIVKSILDTANSVSESRRKWYNQITATADAWLTPQQWDRLAQAETVGDGEQIAVFMDCSKSDDSTAVIGCRISDGFVFRIGIWAQPPNYPQWTVDRDDVDYRVREAVAKWNVVAFWADPSDARDEETGERYWEPYLDGWARDFGRRLRMHAVLSGPFKHPIIWDMRNPMHLKTFTEEAERFVSDVNDQIFRHDGNELLRQHIRNARRRPNKFGIGLGKEHRESARKIDAAVGAVGARLVRRLWLSQQGKGRAPGQGRVVVFD